MKENRMMTYDERMVYERYLNSGRSAEASGKYKLAIEYYEDAVKIASYTMEEPIEALRSIERCNNKLNNKKYSTLKNFNNTRTF